MSAIVDSKSQEKDNQPTVLELLEEDDEFEVEKYFFAD
jgi:hypothetical protein